MSTVEQTPHTSASALPALGLMMAASASIDGGLARLFRAVTAVPTDHRLAAFVADVELKSRRLDDTPLGVCVYTLDARPV